MSCIYFPIDKNKIIDSIRKHHITECNLENLKLIRRETCYGYYDIKNVLEEYLSQSDDVKIIKSIKDHNITEITLENIKVVHKDTRCGLFHIKSIMVEYLSKLKS